LHFTKKAIESLPIPKKGAALALAPLRNGPSAHTEARSATDGANNEKYLGDFFHLQ
jgi:hypothetical protein